MKEMTEPEKKKSLEYSNTYSERFSVRVGLALGLFSALGLSFSVLELKSKR